MRLLPLLLCAVTLEVVSVAGQNLSASTATARASDDLVSLSTAHWTSFTPSIKPTQTGIPVTPSTSLRPTTRTPVTSSVTYGAPTRIPVTPYTSLRPTTRTPVTSSVTYGAPSRTPFTPSTRPTETRIPFIPFTSFIPTTRIPVTPFITYGAPTRFPVTPFITYWAPSRIPVTPSIIYEAGNHAPVVPSSTPRPPHRTPDPATKVIRWLEKINIDLLLNNKRIMTYYVQCFTGKGFCTPESRDFRKLLPRIIATGCGDCTPTQKKVIRKIFLYMYKERSGDWKTLQQRFDPKCKFENKVMNFMGVEIKKPTSR